MEDTPDAHAADEDGEAPTHQTPQADGGGEKCCGVYVCVLCLGGLRS